MVLPPPSLEAAVARARRSNSDFGRRVLLPCAVVLAHFWHVFNDTWYETLAGAVTHVSVSIALVLLAWRGYRPLAALLALDQPTLLAAWLGALSTIRSPVDGVESHVVYRFEFDPGDGCLLEPDTRLLSCPAIEWHGCVPPLFNYTPVNMAATTFVERAAYTMFGSPSTSYFGPLPTPEELREAARQVPPTIYDLSVGAASAGVNGITPAMAWQIRFDLPTDSETVADEIRVRVASFPPDLLVVATVDLTRAQLRFTSDPGGTVPGYESVDLTLPQLRGDRRPEM